MQRVPAFKETEWILLNSAQ